MAIGSLGARQGKSSDGGGSAKQQQQMEQFEITNAAVRDVLQNEMGAGKGGAQGGAQGGGGVKQHVQQIGQLVMAALEMLAQLDSAMGGGQAQGQPAQAAAKPR